MRNSFRSQHSGKHTNGSSGATLAGHISQAGPQFGRSRRVPIALSKRFLFLRHPGVDPDIAVSAKTVGELRNVTACPENLARIATRANSKRGRSVVKVSKRGEPCVAQAVKFGSQFRLRLLTRNLAKGREEWPESATGKRHECATVKLLHYRVPMFALPRKADFGVTMLSTSSD